MKIVKKLILVVTFLNISTYCYENIEEYIIEKTNHQFNLVNDYQVDMIVRVSVPAFRMPKKKYKVFYSKPNKVKVKAKGFGILPKTGLFTSPSDNFDNLKNIRLTDTSDSLNINDIVIVGDLIVDSLKVEMPNEYSKLAFDPIVEVRIDTFKWVIKDVTTKLDTLKLFHINNSYELYDNEFYMPKESVVKYFIKDKKLFNWLNKDAGNIIGQGKSLSKKSSSIVEGTIKVEYKNYKLNKGIKESIFD